MKVSKDGKFSHLFESISQLLGVSTANVSTCTCILCCFILFVDMVTAYTKFKANIGYLYLHILLHVLTLNAPTIENQFI